MLQHDNTLQLAAAQASCVILKAGGYDALYTQPSGSAFYGNPNPNDFDVLVLLRCPNNGPEPWSVDEDDGLPGYAPGDLDDFVQRMKGLGYKDCGEDGNTSGGNSDEEDYRVNWCALRGTPAADHDEQFCTPREVNLIVTTDIIWYYRQVAASCYCRHIRLNTGRAPHKDQVVAIFRAVREAVNPYKKED